MKESILSLTFDELIEKLRELDQPKYRADQIYYELHNGKKLEEISNIPKDLKEKLLEVYEDNVIEIIKVQKSKDGTQKFLYKLAPTPTYNWFMPPIPSRELEPCTISSPNE